MLDLNSLNKGKAPSTSDKYSVIRTGDLIASLVTNGYQVREFTEQKARKQELKGFGLHMLRLRHPDLILKQDQLFPEIVVKNSYNGTSSYEITLGVFRLVCSNGLVVGNSYESLRVRHIGDVMPRVLNSLASIQVQSKQLTHDIETFSNVILTESQQLDFATRVGQTLVDVNPDSKVSPIASTIDYKQLLTVRRELDRSSDLWTVLNRVQENALNGTLKYMSMNETGQVRASSVRRVRGIQRNIDINKTVWNIASEYAKVG